MARKIRIKIKALDDERIPTYADQDLIEIYDAYDLGAKEKVPQIVLDTPVRKEGRSTNYVTVDYPIVSQIFNLDGKYGHHFNYVEAGKKAYVRGGRYNHPTKGWKSKIVMMTPMEYMKECFLMFKRNGSTQDSVETLIETKESQYDLFEMFDPKVGQLNYPALDYRYNQQEGFHRALYALRKNIKEIPVVIIF